MKWGIPEAEKRRRRQVAWNFDTHWHPWFAWYPVQTPEGWFWLQTVEREKHTWSTWDDGGEFWVYREKRD